ncbi:hypothetical protein CRG98_039451 [Punica granatum]|uniref:Uncharacterized protein n=1 Tax=Punica granatum TaxID=22663 RepID=A0A2I0I827_PUNGR|nr:hypothetical protein CRG98_039451 [Punica granatum]
MREPTHFEAKEAALDPCGPRELSATHLKGSRELPWLTRVKAGSSTPILIFSVMPKHLMQRINNKNMGADKLRRRRGRLSLGWTKGAHGSPLGT